MIITRTPFRISLFGGGTDLPSFYRHHPGGGCVLSMSIDKYMYIVLHPTFDKKTIIKYNKTEIVDDLNDIQHPIAREVLLSHDIDGIEVTSMADVLSGTGLSTSSAYTVGLINALYEYQEIKKTQEEIAAEACDVEIYQLKEPIGKQDQYGTALGGLKFIQFAPTGEVKVQQIKLFNLQRMFLSNFMLFYTGLTHSARDILTEQNRNTLKSEEKFNILCEMNHLTNEAFMSLNLLDFNKIGRLLNDTWQLKKQLASKITNPIIDRYYQIGLDNGALGGKLLGAGGGGFLLFYCPPENQDQLRAALNLQELPFSIDKEGTKVIYKGDICKQ